MKEDMADRARHLLDLISLSELAEPNSSTYVRWQNIKRGRARFSTAEIEQLGTVLPAYRWWLLTGEVMPEVGQTSPAYDEANRKLHNQNVG